MKRDQYDPRPRWYRTGVVGLLVCLVVAGGITLLRPPPNEVPISWVDVAEGDPGQGQWIAGEVLSSETTTVMYAGESTAPVVETDHQLVVARLKVGALREQQLLTKIWLVTTDGREYEQVRTGGWSFAPLPAGFTMTASVVFEIPADATPARLEIRPEYGVVIVYAEGLRIDLDPSPVAESRVPERRTVETTR
ncbi:DUF4352 domain-containing protein [Parenemella sanctibonifatiensis]|uniref:DUF4352 domain-containing protein n=1 Tax=Parenemella sanctibonifatiensis TaxID=2016505 RepID=A0A255EL59_9ACTN|nr:hypothetical protein [Parenemella sanctibonifatiensis]OYN92267.1 hypothetical protein CGZ91_01790 [Parenemella sanctibonifatiensis]